MTNCSRLLVLACGFIATLASAPGIAAAPIDIPSVKLRVDDYAVVADTLLARAQEEVTQLYAAIGVRASWLETRHLPSRPPAASTHGDVGAPDLILVVLNPSMTARLAPPPNAVGMAASTPSGEGRIAYVFYDRLKTVLPLDNGSNMAALGFVMAHEIGHLLLPYGSHSETGVMRGRWDLEGFRRFDLRRLRFTPLQGQQIRRRLGDH